MNAVVDRGEEEPYEELRPSEEARSSLEMTEKMLDSAEEKDTNALELSEAEDYIDTSEDTDDEDDDEQTKEFLQLMGKAEKRNARRLQAKQNKFSAPRSDWRSPQLAPHDSDSEDTEDEDDSQETSRFLGIMQAGKQKQKGNRADMVNIRWTNGKVEVTNLPPNIVVSRVPGSGLSVRESKEELISRRRRELLLAKQESSREQADRAQPVKGKRKFEDRMTLTEAKVTDFQDTKDYVDFIQAKLQNVNIKLIK